MQIDRVSYQRVFAIGNYVTERIGLEASLDPGDNPETELSHLKQMVNELHSATIASLEEFRGTKVVDVKEEPVDKIASWKEVIKSCRTIIALERFKPQVDRENNEELTETYNGKLKELQ